MASDVEELIDMARGHGEMSEPDMEVGDLQEALRMCWAALTDYQREVLYKQISEMIGIGGAEEPPDDLTLEPPKGDGSGSLRG